MLTSLSLVGSGTTTPRQDTSKRGAAKRKQTLLSLLDALNELTNDEEAFSKGETLPAFRTHARFDVSTVLESNLQPSFQDDRDVREWFHCATCRPERAGDLTYQQPPSMSICRLSGRSLLRGLRGQ